MAVPGQTFLHDLISSIVERRSPFGRVSDNRPLDTLCHELLSGLGEVSSKRIGAAILDRYRTLSADDQLALFQFLADDLDLDVDAVASANEAYRTEPSAENLASLIEAAEPRRQELLRRLNHVPNATGALVSMRADLGHLMHDHPALKRVDLDFSHLLSSWFNRGFLEVQPISWNTSASVLAKIIQYEAVHAINDWDDLRRRLQPSDRRCFAFFHPAMRDEPLVFVEVALCKGTPNSVQSLLSEERDVLEAEDADTAVFYSISNCQAGLRGISFGNSLIKQVVSDLSVDLPGLQTFVTLSPIPGFSNWLTSALSPASVEEVNYAKNTDGSSVLEALAPYEDDLKALAARYLLNAKRDDGLPRDPVARFHLGNGASVYALHAMADVSLNGIGQSFGVMVNYHYEMSQIETNHEDFAVHGRVTAARGLTQLAAAKLSRLVAASEEKAPE